MKKLILLITGLLIIRIAPAQTNVHTSGQKYTLLEEATSTFCGWDPDGTQDIQQSVQPMYPRAIVACWHTMYGPDPMILSGDPWMNTTDYVNSVPTAVIDRAPLGDTSVWTVAKKRPWELYVGRRDSMTPNFDVSLNCSFNDTTRLLNITVTGTALVSLTGTWNMSALILEDSISSGLSMGAGYNQRCEYINGMPTACNSMPNWYYLHGITSSGHPEYYLPDTCFSHMNVVRAVLSTGGSVWGEHAFTNPNAGDSISKSYSYSIPASFNPHFIKVIGLVQQYGATQMEREVENCIQAKVALMMSVSPTNVRLVSELTCVELFPNPAHNFISLKGFINQKSNTEIIICNALGQPLFDKIYPECNRRQDEVIDLENLPSGMYSLEISTEEGKAAKTFVINR